MSVSVGNEHDSRHFYGANFTRDTFIDMRDTFIDSRHFYRPSSKFATLFQKKIFHPDTFSTTNQKYRRNSIQAIYSLYKLSTVPMKSALRPQKQDSGATGEAAVGGGWRAIRARVVRQMAVHSP